ncbi:MAG: DJ-1/PfpI family protein [Lachnospiraceae bacterium]|nr:DJ-1/PfpI family protein [Lachnospiraceae bacterium]
MSKAYILMADGVEEVEAIATADVLIRAGVEVGLIGITPMQVGVQGSHGIKILVHDFFNGDTDYALERFGDADALILPGGKAGTENLGKCKDAAELVKKYYEAGKYVCAICAAPTVLAACGILDGLEVTCYPEFDTKLADAIYVDEPVKVTGTVITGRSMGTAVDFGLAIAKALVGVETAAKVEKSLCRN